MNKRIKYCIWKIYLFDAELVERELRKSGMQFEKMIVSNKQDFEKALETFRPDIILSDHSLPSFDSTSALKLIQEKKYSVPFILITATVSEEFAVDILKRGAADYILKDRLQRLPLAVENALSKWEIERDLHKQYKIIADYKYALDQSSIVAVTDQKEIIKYANDNFCAISKFSREELIGQDHRIINSGFHSKGFIRNLWTTIASGQVWKGEFKNKAKDGTFYWVDTTVVPFLNSENKPYQYLSIRIDITEKKLAQEELQVAHNKLLFHIENTPLGFIEWGHGGKIKTWSKQAELIFGFTEEELLRTEMSAFTQVHEEDLQHVMDMAKRLRAGLIQRYTLEHRNYTKDGRLIWCESYNSALKDKDGEVVTVMSLVQDITERKKSEEQLKQSALKLKEAQAIAKICNWEIEFVQNQMTCSDEFFHLYGMNKDEVQPSTELFLSCMHPDDADAAHAKMLEAFETLKASSFSFRFIRKDGAVRNGFAEWRFEVDLKGKPLRLYGILKDVTERILADEERDRMIEDIVQRNKDLEQFSYIISHNLRAPVANIIGYANAFSNLQVAESEKTELLSGLSNSVHKLDGVIKDLNLVLQVKREINEQKVMIRFATLVEDIKTSIQNILEENKVIIKPILKP
ncbi:MAG: PAS domain S-box protein [Bacteroidetes bacterium]|nr:PAS domain S-box protein [Bacteroidota bacterium]